MKSVVIREDQKEVKYPCLLEHKRDGYIILVDKSGTVATVVHSKNEEVVGKRFNFSDPERGHLVPCEDQVLLSN